MKRGKKFLKTKTFIWNEEGAIHGYVTENEVCGEKQITVSATYCLHEPNWLNDKTRKNKPKWEGQLDYTLYKPFYRLLTDLAFPQTATEPNTFTQRRIIKALEKNKAKTRNVIFRIKICNCASGAIHGYIMENEARGKKQITISVTYCLNGETIKEVQSKGKSTSDCTIFAPFYELITPLVFPDEITAENIIEALKVAKQQDYEKTEVN